MDKKKILPVCISALCGFIGCRSMYEVSHIKTTHYKLTSKKLPENTKINIVFLSDLHCKSYGPENEALLKLVYKAAPDYIFIGGDMVTASKKAACHDKNVIQLLINLKKIAPVYYAMGNHEEYLKAEGCRFGRRFSRLEAFLYAADIPLLCNSHIDLDGNISVYGLEISKRYYRRTNRKAPEKKYMPLYLGRADESRYNILLAHNPAFFDVYESWKSDLVLSGHYHGGIIGIPSFKNKENRGGMISPDLKLFPKYCAGKFKKNNTDFIVSAGCGTHSINFRLFNRPEVVAIELSSET